MNYLILYTEPPSLSPVAAITVIRVPVFISSTVQKTDFLGGVIFLYFVRISAGGTSQRSAPITVIRRADGKVVTAGSHSWLS